MIEYKIVYPDLENKLEKKVNSLILEGWIPLGGIGAGYGFICQAMIRETEKMP